MKDDSNLVECSCCRFCFCVLCMHAWHGVSPCKLIPSDLKERETWEKLVFDNRQILEKQYGKEHLHQAFQEYDSFQWIQSNAKRCPTCSAKIEKTQGCNKMTCTYTYAYAHLTLWTFNLTHSFAVVTSLYLNSRCVTMYDDSNLVHRS